MDDFDHDNGVRYMLQDIARLREANKNLERKLNLLTYDLKQTRINYKACETRLRNENAKLRAEILRLEND